MKIIFSLIISLMILNVGLSAEDLREDTRYSENDPKAYTLYDLKHNMEVIKKATEKISTRRLDNNVWVYTEEFAKRFGMPKRWIGGEDFKGALALAYRDEIYNVRTCGYFQSWEGCREFENQCVLDIYVPHNSETIPWNTNKYYAHGSGGGAYSSSHWLEFEKDANGKFTPQGQKDLESFRGYKGEWHLWGKVGIDSIVWAHRFRSDGFGESGGNGSVSSFHRNIFEGIDIITINMTCNFATSGDGEMQIWLAENIYNKQNKTKRDLELLENSKKLPGAFIHKNRDVHHKIYPGKSFMERIKVYKEEYKENSFFEYFKKNINKNNKN